MQPEIQAKGTECREFIDGAPKLSGTQTFSIAKIVRPRVSRPVQQAAFPSRNADERRAALNGPRSGAVQYDFPPDAIRHLGLKVKFRARRGLFVDRLTLALVLGANTFENLFAMNPEILGCLDADLYLTGPKPQYLHLYRLANHDGFANFPRQNQHYPFTSFLGFTQLAGFLGRLRPGCPLSLRDVGSKSRLNS